MTDGRVQIKQGREKPIRNRHPWIFSGAIARAENAANSELVTVVDHHGRFLARGYWNAKSQIQVRILTWQDEPIDDAWWRRRLQGALSLRSEQEMLDENGACRLVNAESDYLPGLIIDRYADWAVLQALTLFVDRYKRQIAAALTDVCGLRNIYERSDADARAREGMEASVGLLDGQPAPELIEFVDDARYLVDFKAGHKTGFYLDQRDNRRRLAALVSQLAQSSTEPIKLLNLFSYSAAFAIAAGRIDSVRSVNVDSSRAALALAERTFALNGFRSGSDGETSEFVQADCFDYLHHLTGLGEQFDLVILDPPKFARHKRQVLKAARGYKGLNLGAFKLIKPGGYLMTFSCSAAVTRDLFQKIVFGALVDSGREAQVVQQLSASADHPVALTFPQGEYLKGLLLRVF